MSVVPGARSAVRSPLAATDTSGARLFTSSTPFATLAEAGVVMVLAMKPGLVAVTRTESLVPKSTDCTA